MMGPSFVPQMGFISPPPPAYELIPYRVFVGGFPPETTEEELLEHFSPYFQIKEANIVRTIDGVSKGFGFLSLKSESDAENLRVMDQEKLMFRGRKLNLGPALKKKTTNRFPTEYAVATPTGLLQPGMFGYGYVTQPYMMPHPQFMYNGPVPHGYQMMYPAGNPMECSMQPAPPNDVNDCERSSHSSTMSNSVVTSQATGYPYAYMVPVPQSPPVPNQCHPYMGHPSMYRPDGLLTPISAPPAGYQPHSQVPNVFFNHVMAAGDSRNVQCTPEEYGMPYSTPPQRAYASVVAANTPAMTPPQEMNGEQLHPHSSAVRRINLFSDAQNVSKSSGPNSFTTPVRLESRPKGPDGAYRSSAKTTHLRYARSPRPDFRKQTDSVDDVSSRLLGKLSNMHISHRLSDDSKLMSDASLDNLTNDNTTTVF